MDINELRARDARRQELRVAKAEIKGRLNAQSEQAQAISTANAATPSALPARDIRLVYSKALPKFGLGEPCTLPCMFNP